MHEQQLQEAMQEEDTWRIDIVDTCEPHIS